MSGVPASSSGWEILAYSDHRRGRWNAAHYQPFELSRNSQRRFPGKDQLSDREHRIGRRR